MAEQMAFPCVVDEAKLTEFLTAWNALEDEEVRIREEKRLCKEDYKECLPMRAVLTAIKRVRAANALEHHPKEPLARPHQGYLETLVEAHLAHIEAENQALTEEAEGL